MSDYMRDLRARVGTSLLEIPSVALAIRDEAGRVLLGRTVADGRWLLPGRYPNGDEIAFVATVFEARVAGGAETPDGEELDQLRWFDREACAGLDTPAWVPPILADAFAGTAEAAFAPSDWQPQRG
jgi:hypothetical protein